MCSVAWCSFSWEAFATLVTGILAVGAAVWIGQKQIKITNRQVALERLKMRSDLFDRRVEIYGAVRDWFQNFIANGGAENPEMQRRFREAIYMSEFLFRSEVTIRLREWYVLGVRHHAQLLSNRHDDAHETAQAIIAASNELPDLLGPEMRLGEALPDR